MIVLQGSQDGLGILAEIRELGGYPFVDELHIDHAQLTRCYDEDDSLEWSPRMWLPLVGPRGAQASGVMSFRCGTVSTLRATTPIHSDSGV